MQDKKMNDNDKDERDERDEPAEEAEHPLEGIKHKHEPDAENIMPAEDRPGTM